MLTKTNTLKSSQSTSVTSFRTYSEAASRSPDRTRKVKNDNYVPLLSNEQEKACKLQVIPEIILIRKEKTFNKSSFEDDSKAKKRLSISPMSKRLSVNGLDRNKIILQKAELKLLDTKKNDELMEIKPILKISSFLNKIAKVSQQNVKFADENEKRPLALVYMVESYRNYKIYSSKMNNSKNKEEVNERKAVCRCSCVIY